nr:MAG: hypothetical protein CM15mV30_0340 [uncultured marine virus]
MKADDEDPADDDSQKLQAQDQEKLDEYIDTVLELDEENFDEYYDSLLRATRRTKRNHIKLEIVSCNGIIVPLKRYS